MKGGDSMHYVPYYDRYCHEYKADQVKRIFKAMGYRVEVLYIYKCKTRRYNVRDIDTDFVVLANVTMVWLRICLTYLGVPSDYLIEPTYKRKK